MSTSPSSSGLGGQAARGAVVTIGAQAGRIVIQVLSVVILARLLVPRDYGLIAMVTAVVGIAEVFRDFGLSAAAIQAKSLSRAQRTNLYWINTVVGLVLGVVVAVVAPILANAYGEPRLTHVAQGMAVLFVLNGAATQYRADLSRHLRFGRLAVADLVSPLVGLVAAVGVAVQGGGVWSLVVQQVVQVLVMLILVVVFAGWLPGRPSRDVEMIGLLRFGWNLAGSQLVGYVSNNIDSVIIGARFGPGQLGIYNRAFQLLMTPLAQLRAPTTTVALPVLAKLQEEPARFTAFVQRGQVALGCTIVAGLAFVAGAADPLTEILLGDRWEAVTPILRLLAVAGAFQTLAYVGYWVYLSKGLTHDLFRYSLVSATIKVGCVVVGSSGGLLGVAIGYAIAPALAWPLSFWWLSRRAAVGVWSLFAGAARILFLATAVGGAAALASWLTSQESALLSVSASALASASAYLLLVLAARPIRADVVSVLRVGRQAVHRIR